MKKYKLILISALAFLNTNSSYDVILLSDHYVNNCIEITNTSDYPTISFIACVENSSSLTSRIYEVTSHKCLKGSRFCKYSIYAIKRDKIANKNIKNINWAKNKNSLKSNITIESFPEYLFDSNPISSVRQCYKIAGFTNTCVVLYKWKEVFKFNNGAFDSTEIYNYIGDITKLSQNFPIKDKKAL